MVKHCFNFISKVIDTFELILFSRLYGFFLGLFSGIIMTLICNQRVPPLAICFFIFFLSVQWFTLLLRYWFERKKSKELVNK